MKLRQCTLKNAIHCSGIGLHSGAPVGMTLRPAPADSGIRFRRVDLPGEPEIPADWRHAYETPLCSTIRRDGAEVATIEHLMAAFYGCGLDNVTVDIDGPEVPAMDGSAAPFMFVVECAGTREQAAPRRVLQILEPVTVEEPERRVSLAPHRNFQVRFEIEFESPVIGHEVMDATLTRSLFRQEIARARTFGFLEEVTRLRAAGLALGGTLDNAIVIDGDRVLNEGGLRYTDEFVRHKVLDSVGDLYMAGGPIIGAFEGLRAGHAITLRLLQRLFDTPDAWAWCELDAAEAGAGAEAATALMPAVAQRA